MTLRFGQSCPTCGRRINIRMELLGRSVACPHCQAEFIASERPAPQSSSDQLLMARVERALQRCQGTLSLEPLATDEAC